MLPIASRLLTLALRRSRRCQTPLLTPGGVGFMVQCSGPRTASEFMKLISELIERRGFYYHIPHILIVH